MTTNETQSKEWIGDDWRVIARPGQVIAMTHEPKPQFGSEPEWRGWMDCDLASARRGLKTWRKWVVDEVQNDALEAAIAYAWPESVGTFTDRGVAV